MKKYFSWLSIFCLLLVSCKEDVKTPVITPTEAFKVSGTISAIGENIGLNGIANTNIVLKNGFRRLFYFG